MNMKNEQNNSIQTVKYAYHCKNVDEYKAIQREEYKLDLYCTSFVFVWLFTLIAAILIFFKWLFSEE